MSKTFKVSKHCEKSTYQKPAEITCFSFDESRKLHLNSRISLANYSEPSLPADLNQGYPDRYVKRSTEPEHLDALIHALNDCRQTSFDFVTWRGIMTKIMASPYLNDDWELNATLYNNTIYLEENDQQKRIDESNQTDRMHRMTFYGYKFEALCTNSETVNTNVQFCSVFKTRVGTHSVAMGAEVDCISDKKHYVELKTNRILSNRRAEYNFIRFKLLKTWIQSYLVGIPTIIFGFRDDDGQLREIKRYDTSELQRKARNYQNNGKSEIIWDPNVCIAFANQLLEWIKQHVVIDDPCIVYKISFKSPHQHIVLEPATRVEKSFLPI